MSETTDQTLDERYPEHAKQRKIMDKSQGVYNFLQWAQQQGYDFGRTVTTRVAVFEGTEDVTAVQPVEGTQLKDLLAKHFGIDPGRLNAEKEQMIEDLRAAHR